MFQVSRGAYILLRLLSVTDNQETQWLLDEIQRQPSMYVLSGPATVITNIAAASALLADGWSTESVSRVVRTARTRRENHKSEHAEHVYNSQKHEGVTISDAFPVTGQGFNGGKHPAENTRVLPCHRVNTNSCHLACTRFPHSPTVLFTFVSCSASVEPTSTTLSTLH